MQLKNSGKNLPKSKKMLLKKNSGKNPQKYMKIYN